MLARSSRLPLWLVFACFAFGQAASSDAVSIQLSAEKRSRIISASQLAGVNLKEAVAHALDVEPWNVIAPDWFEKVRYDILLNTAVPSPDIRPAIRQALAEKFSLILREEQRPVDVWVMRTPAWPAPGVRETTAQTRTRGCGMTTGASRTRISSQGCSIDMTVRMLERFLNSTVLNETSLDGHYEFEVIWDKNDLGATMQSWHEQLGIELTQETRMMDVVVVDSAMRPPELLADEGRTRYPCEASPEIRSLLAALPSMSDFSLPYNERMKPRRQLARDYPYDVFVQMAVQDAFRRKPHLAEDWDAALASYRAMNNAVLGPFLEARLLADVQPRLSESLLLGVMERAPDFPWAHLALVEWTEEPGRRDLARAGKHMREFRRLCPESLAAFAHYRNIENPEVLYEAERALRGLLSRRVDLEATAAWQHDWSLLFRIGPRERAHTQVRADLLRLRFLNQITSSEWLETMRYGYQLLGDENGRASLDALILREIPESDFAYQALRDRWSREHPLDATVKDRRELLAALGKWKAKWPDLPRIARERWQTMLQIPDLSPADRLSIAGEYLAASTDHPDFVFSIRSPPIEVAELYVQHKARLDQVPRLVELGVQQIERMAKFRPESDERKSSEIADTRSWGYKTLAQAFLLLGEKEKAEVILGRSSMASRDGSVRVPMAEFTRADWQGRVWSLGDLRGKVVLLHFWATWCSSCMAQLPYVQRLHELLTTREDRLVLTITVDESPEPVTRVLEQNRYTFPVLPGRDLAERILAPGFVPQNWLIDSEGRRVVELFNGSGDAWIKQILDAMEGL